MMACPGCGRLIEGMHPCQPGDATIIRDLKISLENAKAQIVTLKAELDIKHKCVMCENGLAEICRDCW